MEKRKIDYRFLVEIFLSFFKISPLSFGGGFAMIPIMEKEVVYNKKWISKEQIVDVFAVIQSLPGAIAVNAATLLGYQIAGIPGALAAFVGIVLPTFGLMIVFGTMLVTYRHNIYVQAALQGIRPVVVAMIAAAACKMSRLSLVDTTCCVIAVVSVVALLLFKGSVFLVIISGAILGIGIANIRDKLYLKKSKKVSDQKS